MLKKNKQYIEAAQFAHKYLEKDEKDIRDLIKLNLKETESSYAAISAAKEICLYDLLIDIKTASGEYGNILSEVNHYQSSVPKEQRKAFKESVRKAAEACEPLYNWGLTAAGLYEWLGETEKATEIYKNLANVNLEENLSLEILDRAAIAAHEVNDIPKAIAICQKMTDNSLIKGDFNLASKAAARMAELTEDEKQRDKFLNLSKDYKVFADFTEAKGGAY